MGEAAQQLAEPVERPILFNCDMVNAILADPSAGNGPPKTHTRRAMSPQPTVRWEHCGDVVLRPADRMLYDGHGNWWPYYGDIPDDDLVRSPYGVRGDLLWVRERTRVIGKRAGVTVLRYEADGEERVLPDWPERIRPVEVGQCLSMGCFREAARLLLSITDDRVERVQDISAEDAEAEGVRHVSSEVPIRDRRMALVQHGFARLWDSVAPAGLRFDDNPWAWVTAFERVTP